MKTPAQAITRLEAIHAAEMNALEDGAQRAVLRVYERVVAEMGRRLLDYAASGADFSAAHLAAIAMQVTAALDAFPAEALVPLEEGSGNAMAAAVRQAAREILVAELAMPEGALRTVLVDALQEWGPQVPVGQVARLAQGQSLLLDAFTVEVRQAVGESLAASVAQGKGARSAARALREAVNGQTYQLERIARTEINNAANIGHDATINDAAARFPAIGLGKRWSAKRDGDRVCPTCLALQAQGTIPPNASFNAGGFQGSHPPAHPNCRCRVIAWSDRWGTPMGKAWRTARHKSTCTTPSTTCGCMPPGPLRRTKAKGGFPMSAATLPPVGQLAAEGLAFATKALLAKELTFSDEDGTIDGYASCWGDPMGKGDSYGDVMVKGAFLDTINERKGEGRKFPFMWSHAFREVPIGTIDPDDMHEDDKGLRFKARLMIAVMPKAREVYEAFKAGALDSFSIGWDPVQVSRPPEGSKAYQLLNKVRLYEVSGVNFAADSQARVVAVKAQQRDATLAWLQELHGECKAGRVLSAANEAKLRQASSLISECLAGLPEPKSAEEPTPPTPEPTPNQDPDQPPEGEQHPEVKAGLAEMRQALEALKKPKEA